MQFVPRTLHQTLAKQGLTLFVAIVVTSSFCVTLAEPPGFGPGQTAALANEVTEFSGKLKGYQRGIVIVTREDGTDVMVKPPEDIAAFTFVADAKPAFLRRGSMVRFSGTFQANGTPTVPVSKVEAFQPVPVKQLKGRAREKFVPGVYPANRNAQQVAVAKCTVVGGLMGISPSGVLMVQAGKRPVQVQLTQDAVFELHYNNLSLAKEGDAVSVVGFYEPPDDTKVRGDRITIKTDRVYGEMTAQQPVKRRSRRTADEKKADGEIAADVADADAEASSENSEKPNEQVTKKAE